MMIAHDAADAAAGVAEAAGDQATRVIGRLPSGPVQAMHQTSTKSRCP